MEMLMKKMTELASSSLNYAKVHEDHFVQFLPELSGVQTQATELKTAVDKLKKKLDWSRTTGRHGESLELFEKW